MRNRLVSLATAGILTFALAGSAAAWTPKVAPVIDTATSYCQWVTTSTAPYTAVHVYLDETAGKPTEWRAFGAQSWWRITGKTLNRYEALSAGTAAGYPIASVTVSVMNRFGQDDIVLTCHS